MFYNPKDTKCDKGLPPIIDYDFAQKEIAQAKGFATGGGAGLTKGIIYSKFVLYGVVVHVKQFYYFNYYILFVFDILFFIILQNNRLPKRMC